jgi:cephalosporin hydroxylase
VIYRDYSELKRVSAALGFPISQFWAGVSILREYGSKVNANQSIIDIGTRNGGSAIILAMSSSSPVYTIDILPDPREPGFGYGPIPPLREHWDSFPFGDRIHQVTCCSWEYVHKGPPVGLVFIDGDHTYEGVKNDWYHFYPMVEEGGYILVHDYDTAQFPDVTRFLHELDTDECVDLGGSIAVFKKGGE